MGHTGSMAGGYGLLVALVLMHVCVVGLPAEDQPIVDDATSATATAWPQRSSIDGRTVTVYQLQPERLTGNVLSARAALAIAPDEGEPVFGAVWMTVRLDIDREQRTASAAAVTVDRVQFPADDAGGLPIATLTDQLGSSLLAAGLVFALDDLIATLEEPPSDLADYNLAAPRILIRTAPTELVVFDGQPRFQTAGGVTLAVNTPAFVCVEASGVWWLRLDQGWLTAPGSTGPWMIAPAPQAVVAAAEGAGLASGPAPAGDALPPDVIIATTPTALVEFAGEPLWTPVGDTGLLAAENCDHDVFIETGARRYWLLLAGRWFSTDLLIDDTTWTPVPPDALPAAFAAIPAESRWGRVRVHISGTEEARKAAIDATVPQTARIPRSATITVTYDGEPRFIAIPGSDTAWAENTSFAVFRTPGPRYWCCAEGVWYEAPEAEGPWTVATTIPDALQRIPADNPHHNVTYVTIYDSQPDYVWTGYTAGYMHCYTYRGCPIYGSGWYSHGYYGSAGYACPRPLTWGVRLMFDPWCRVWGVVSGYRRVHSASVVLVANRTRCGWWGPVRHAPPPVHRAQVVSAWRDEAIARRPQAGITVVTSRDAALYRRVPGAQLPTRTSRPQTRTASHDAGQPVYVRTDGTLIRRDHSGAWQERRDRDWTDATRTDERTARSEPTQRLPRVATQTPPDRRRQAEQPRVARVPPERSVEVPTRTTPPPERPRPELRDRVFVPHPDRSDDRRHQPHQEPPRPRAEEPRRPANDERTPPVTRPGDEPSRHRAEEAPRRRDDLPSQPPVTRPPTDERPRQEPPPRQRVEEPPRRRDEPGQPPVTRSPTYERPPQAPPRVEEPPRRRDEPGQPPVTRSPTNERPPQAPPRQRMPEPPRPERRPSEPTTRPQPPAERQPSTPPPRPRDNPRPTSDQRPSEPPRERPTGGLRPARPDQSVRPSPAPAERERRSGRTDDNGRRR